MDSQAAITRLVQRVNSTASYITEEIYQLVYELTAKFPRANFVVRWMPGHVGLSGNKEVDEEAKKAASSSRFNTNHHFGILKKPLPTSRTVHRQMLKKEVTESYRKEFQRSARIHRAVKYDSSMPSNRYRRLTAGMPRRYASILTQLRTNHVPLRAYLHKVNIAESPVCEQCEEAPETVTHFIMFCPKYSAQRRQLRMSLKSGQNLDLSILGDKDSLPPLFCFIKATECFEDSFSDLTPTDGPQH